MIDLPTDAETGLIKRSAADAFQAKSVSLKRFRYRIGSLSESQTTRVANAVAMCVGA
jgi:hypothetical protein